jgi:hypothetical protein
MAANPKDVHRQPAATQNPVTCVLVQRPRGVDETAERSREADNYKQPLLAVKHELDPRDAAWRGRN